MKIFQREHIALLSLPLLFASLVLFVILLIVEPKNASAQATGGATCDVVIALDKSSSIGADNLEVLKNNVDRLIAAFSTRSDVRVAYWSFSHSDAADFNQPRHDYIATNNTALRNEFVSSLPTADQLEGQTDYAQAYGYSAGDPDPDTINSVNDINLTPNGSVSSIRSQADVVVLLTDGEPNYPGNSNNNPAAVYAGRAARLTYPGGVRMVGGYISDSSGFVPDSLYETINGDKNDHTNVGPVSFGGGANPQIFEYVRTKIEEACGEPPQPSGYWLKPSANITPLTVREGDVIDFGYQVEKDRDEATSQSAGWKLYDVTIKPEVTGNPLDFGSTSSACTNNPVGEGYCDNVTSCGAIYALIGGASKGTCDPVGDRGSGSSTFSGGQNLFYTPNRNVTVGSYEAGTRICSIVVLDVATGSGNTNRASSAACSIVGKSPLVQVYGGDIRAGRYFAGDTTPRPENVPRDKKPGVYTSQFKIRKGAAAGPNGRTYGSWVEYGVLAAGPIEKIASLSGYAGEHGGYDGAINTATCDATLNRLTFANDVENLNDKCGYYNQGLGSMPDLVSALGTKPAISGTYAQPFKIDASTQSSNEGLIYKTADSVTSFEIGGGDSKLERGKTYIVYVPKGTVTISSNIDYADPSGSYADIKDIPQLVIIAKNINIKDNVTQVNAWLVAAGDGETGGKLDTCTGFSPPFSGGICKEPLTINGPVMARDLELWRTKVADGSCTIEVIIDCSNEGDPAEMINLSGSTLLWTQGFTQNSARARTTSTIELPPYF